MGELKKPVKATSEEGEEEEKATVAVTAASTDQLEEEEEEEEQENQDTGFIDKKVLHSKTSSTAERKKQFIFPCEISKCLFRCLRRGPALLLSTKFKRKEIANVRVDRAVVGDGATCCVHAKKVPLAAATQSTLPPDNFQNFLNPDLWARIASYLNPADALHLATCCKAARRELPLSSLNSKLITSRRFRGDVTTGDAPRQGPQIPIFFRRRIHSITFQCRWHDQGWGNQKGRLFILGHNRHQQQRDFLNGRRVATSPVADHYATHLSLVFVPRETEVYSLWYIVGGGGGHELVIRNATIHKVVYADDEEEIGLMDVIPPNDATETASDRTDSAKSLVSV